MTQRTHDLAAVVFVSYRFLAFPTTGLTWETLIGIGLGAILGGLTPDIDNVASKAWKHNVLPWEDDLTRHALKGHRNLSHSLLGLGIFTGLFWWLTSLLPVAGFEASLVAQAYALGFLSHLATDALTKDAVPWFYPIDIHIGFPPLRWLRMKTGGLLEKVVIFPGLLAMTIWLFYTFRTNVTYIFKSLSP